MNRRKDKREKKAWQWDRTLDLVSSEQGYGLVEQTSVSHPRGRRFDPAGMLLFFFFLSFLELILFVFIYLCCFIYNIYRTTYLRKIIFPCTAHNERSFFLFQYLTNYSSLKLRTNENNERRGALLWTVTEIPLISLKRWSDFQTRKLTI